MRKLDGCSAPFPPGTEFDYRMRRMRRPDLGAAFSKRVDRAWSKKNHVPNFIGCAKKSSDLRTDDRLAEPGCYDEECSTMDVELANGPSGDVLLIVHRRQRSILASEVGRIKKMEECL